jgi:hypothetical protein
MTIVGAASRQEFRKAFDGAGSRMPNLRCIKAQAPLRQMMT